MVVDTKVEESEFGDREVATYILKVTLIVLSVDVAWGILRVDKSLLLFIVVELVL